jgi:protein-disulfide isomerase
MVTAGASTPMSGLCDRKEPKMFEARNLLAVCMGVVLLAPNLPALADEASDLSSLKQDIEALKAGQRQIGQDLSAIKQLLQSLRKSQQRPQPVEDVDLVMDVAKEPFKGDANAPLTLVEMTDFQCPFCGRHANSVLPQILKNYVSTGKLKYVVRDFPLPFHKNAKKAAAAAHCAESQGKYWEMHNLLFENQKALDTEHLAGYAAQLGLDTKAFNTCLEGKEAARKVAANQAEGNKAGVTGTPTMFLGRTQADGKVKITKRITGAQPYAVFQQTIDAMLAAKGGSAFPEAAQPQKEKAGN